jgi:hypothetical protein
MIVSQYYSKLQQAPRLLLVLAIRLGAQQRATD